MVVAAAAWRSPREGGKIRGTVRVGVSDLGSEVGSDDRDGVAQIGVASTNMRIRQKWLRAGAVAALNCEGRMCDSPFWSQQPRGSHIGGKVINLRLNVDD